MHNNCYTVLQRTPSRGVIHAGGCFGSASLTHRVGLVAGKRFALSSVAVPNHRACRRCRLLTWAEHGRMRAEAILAYVHKLAS